MISLVVILSVLSFPAATGLICEHCTGNSLFCETESSFEECDPGYACGSQYTEHNSVDSTYSSLVRRCTPLCDCGSLSSATTQNYYTTMVISCCSYDGCEPDVIKTLQTMGEYRPNGLVCPGCPPDKSWCRTTVKCRGDEHMCFHNAIKTQGLDLLQIDIRGCATQLYCDRDDTITCTKASKSI